LKSNGSKRGVGTAFTRLQDVFHIIKFFSDSMNTHPLSWVMWISIAQLLFDATRILRRMHVIYKYIYIYIYITIWVHLCYVPTKYTNVVKYVHFVKMCKPHVEWIHNLSDDFFISITERYNTHTIDLHNMHEQSKVKTDAFWGLNYTFRSSSCVSMTKRCQKRKQIVK